MLSTAGLKQPVSCMENTCSKYGVKHYYGQKLCTECGGDMFPDSDFNEPIVDDWQFTDDMIERMKQHPVTPIIVKHDDTFRCAPDVKGCPIAAKAKVYVPIDLYNKWIYLAGQFKTEWIAYLKGHAKADKKDEYEITDMYFPKQRASAAHCEAEDGEIQEDTIAAVHSHVGMNVFFSGEDEAHFNHNIELVVNNKGEILATGRTQLECGRYHRGPADIYFTGCEEEIELEEALTSQLAPEKRTTFTTNTKATQTRLPGLV